MIEKRFYLTIYDIDTVSDIKKLENYDMWTLQDINVLTVWLDKLKEHRSDIAKRAAEVISMNYRYKILLQRENNYKIRYFLQLIKIFDDGTDILESSKAFEGKERHAAIKEYKELCKLYPGAEHKMDIAKKKWEI